MLGEACCPAKPMQSHRGADVHKDVDKEDGAIGEIKHYSWRGILLDFETRRDIEEQRALAWHARQPWKLGPGDYREEQKALHKCFAKGLLPKAKKGFLWGVRGLSLAEQDHNLYEALEAKGTAKLTPLLKAASEGKLEDVQLLCWAGASLKAVDGEGKTASQLAEAAGHADIVAHLRMRERREQAELKGYIKRFLWARTERDELIGVIKAAEDGRVEDVRVMLEAGESGDARSIYPWTNWNAMHYAAFKGHLPVARVLAEFGGKQILTDQSDDDGRTCLHLAVEYGHKDLVKFLIEQGGRDLLRIQDKFGWTCLHDAAERGAADMVAQCLAKGGCELALLKSDKGKTALDVAKGSECEATSSIKKIVDLLQGAMEQARKASSAN